MDDLLKHLKSIWNVLMITGVIVLVASFFDVQNFFKGQLSPFSSPYWFGAALGLFIFVTGLAMTLHELGVAPGLRSRRTRPYDNGWTTKFGGTQINVVFGCLQDKAPNNPAPDAAVVLPASEFLDDHCLQVPRTACAAYVSARISDAKALKLQLAKARAALGPGHRVEKEPGVYEISYGIGQCIFLKKAAATTPGIFLAAVSTKRTGVGLKSNPGHIDAAIETVICGVSDARLASVHMPLLGAGEGGLPEQASLMTVLLALMVSIRRRAPSSLKSVTIVVYRRDSASAPAIPIQVARSILETVARLNAEWR